MDISRLPPQLQGIAEKLLHPYNVPLPGGFSFSPNLLQAILMVVLIFLLIYTLGHLRHTYVDWSIKGIMPGLTFGFVLAILIEGLFLIGGKTLFTEIIGWENAPKPISNVLDTGREKIIGVLGVKDSIPNSKAAQNQSASSIISSIQNLSKEEMDLVRENICKVRQ